MIGRTDLVIVAVGKGALDCIWMPLAAFVQQCGSHGSKSMRALPPCPCQRPCDVDDIITASSWVFFVPGNAKPDPKVDPAYLLQLKAAIGKIKRPFRRKADAKPGRDQRHQRIGVIALKAMLAVRSYSANFSLKYRSVV